MQLGKFMIQLAIICFLIIMTYADYKIFKGKKL